MERVNITYNKENFGMYIHANSDFISREIRLSQTFYEYGLLSFLQSHFQKQTNILDIGANIGNHSLFFAKYLDFQHLYAFEPIVQNREVFQKNMSDYEDKYTLYEHALSDKDGEMTLYNTWGLENYGGYSLNKEDHSFIVCDHVKVVRLDDYNLTGVTLIKMDVENHEKEVLLGGKQTIFNNKPILVLENNYYYFSHIYPDPNPHGTLLTEWGYERIFTNVENSSMDIWAPVKFL